MRTSNALVVALMMAPMKEITGQGVEVDFRRYAVPTDSSHWDECALEYTEQCPPTISIEQAACEAPLVVRGQVLQTVNGATRLDTVTQIRVEYRSEFFGSVDRRTIQKWGAGLENNDGGIFTNSSGFFQTWVTGFNNTPTDSEVAGRGTTPCGTRAPRSQETLFFFLEKLPENEGKVIAFEPDGVSLNVNFSLSTKILQTGHVDDNADTYRLVNTGAFGDDNLLEGAGNCEAVYCCYNPDCGRCGPVLEEVKDRFQCADTFTEESVASTASLGVAFISVISTGFALLV